MNYVELESKLKSIPTIETVKPYRSDNFITPWVVGFIPLVKNVSAEISYGEAFGGGYCIGFTLFENEKLMSYEKREGFDWCFMEDEINNISEYVNKVKNEIKL